MLTRKQYDLLIYIDQYIVVHGISPSFEEMKEALSLKSKSGIHRLVSSLEERGFILRLSNRARAIEVLRLPKNAPADHIPASNRKLISCDFSRKHSVNQDTVYVPLRGRIAAGLPKEAIENHEMEIEVPSALLGKGNYYALEVEGESMSEKGILAGDTVIIEYSETADQGDIVVALIDDVEAMLKIFFYEKPHIILKSAHPSYPPRSYQVGQVRIQGRLCGLIRKY